MSKQKTSSQISKIVEKIARSQKENDAAGREFIEIFPIGTPVKRKSDKKVYFIHSYPGQHVFLKSDKTVIADYDDIEHLNPECKEDYQKFLNTLLDVKKSTDDLLQGFVGKYVSFLNGIGGIRIFGIITSITSGGSAMIASKTLSMMVPLQDITIEN